MARESAVHLHTSEAQSVPSQCVDAPPPEISRGRRASRTGRHASPVPLTVDLRDERVDASREQDWDELLAAALRKTPVPSPEPVQSLPSAAAPVPQTVAMGVLPPGVIDTRPAGVRVIDLRDGVQVRDGVLDTRPHGIASLVDTPPSPFDVDTLEVRRVVSGAAPDAVVRADPPQVPVSSGHDADASPDGCDAAAPASATRSAHMRRSEMRRLESRAAKRSSGTLSVPQVGIASALGLATIAAPLSGALSAPGQAGMNQLTRSAASAVVVAAAPAPVAVSFPHTVPAPPNAVEAARVVVDDTRLSDVPSALAPPGRLLVTRASRGSAGRAVLPGCDGVVPPSGLNALNGRLPASALCTLWDGNEKLRADAAVAFAKLNVAYKQEFGKSICVTDSYRTLSEQYTVKALRGGYAAAPGTSDHGRGTAVDLCGGGSVARTPMFTWLRANAARYGWANPDWAKSTLYEPWHWEYLPDA